MQKLVERPDKTTQKLMKMTLGQFWFLPFFFFLFFFCRIDVCLYCRSEKMKKVITGYLKEMHVTMLSCMSNVTFFVQESCLSNNNEFTMRFIFQILNCSTVEIQ